MHIVRRLGFPIVNTGCEFFRPATSATSSRSSSRSASSVELDQLRIRGGSRRGKFLARHKVALISLDTLRALPIPDDLRAPMLDYVAAGGG